MDKWKWKIIVYSPNALCIKVQFLCRLDYMYKNFEWGEKRIGEILNNCILLYL